MVKKRLKSLSITSFKLAIAIGLIAWMVESDKLELNGLLILVKQPALLAFAVISWVIGPVLLGSFRWHLLLIGAGYNLPWHRSLVLHLTGLFFNSAMPGAVGGDLIKVGYVIRDNRNLGLTPAMMSIILDRVIGLFGLFTIGFCFILANFSIIASTPFLKSSAILITGFMIVMVVIYSLALIRYNGGDDPISRLLQKRYLGFNIALKIYSAFRQYHHKSRFLFYGLAISISIQALMLGIFIALTKAMISPDIALAKLGVIFPIGILTTALPLAPGGLGVGHIAFERLFTLVGLNGGANVFNVYVLSQLALNLLGVIPYLLLKKKQPIPLEPSQLLDSP